MSGWFTTFMNCRQCIAGELVEDQLVVSDETGTILKRTGYIGGEAIDLEGGIIAPGLLELQTNGVLGFHFTHHENDAKYGQELEKVARFYATQGVTGFWATIPTVSPDHFKKVLPCLRPRSFPNSASILGAHAEGPYLHVSKAGAHNPLLFQLPDQASPTSIYGDLSPIKLVTLAPELEGSSDLISHLTGNGIKVSLGHTTATYTEGLTAVSAGAIALTHTLNAMGPLHHRAPSLAALLSPTSAFFPSDSTSLDARPNPAPPYYSLIADGHHLHPAVVSLLHRAHPPRCVLVTDSVELAGLADGVYAGHAQVEGRQVKSGSRVVKEGTETLVGGCASLQECVRNLMAFSGCSLAQAVRCATENIADMMGDTTRGKLEEGRRADFVVMNDEGEVLQTWIGGVKVWEKGQ